MWYCGEFDLSYYDGYEIGTMQAQIIGHGTAISTLAINGTQTGKIDGTVTAVNTGGSSPISIGSINFNGKKTSNDSPNAAKTAEQSLKDAQASNPVFFNKLWTKVQQSVTNGAINSIGDLAGKITTGAINWITNPLTSLFNSFIGGGKSNVPQEWAVNLTMNTEISLTGEISSSPLIVFNKHINLPNNNPQNGIVSNIDHKIGVWYVRTKPVIHQQTQAFRWNGAYAGYYDIEDYLYLSAGDIAINPTISNKYLLTDLKYYIVGADGAHVAMTGQYSTFEPAYYDGRCYYRQEIPTTQGNECILFHPMVWYYPDSQLNVRDFRLQAVFSIMNRESGVKTTHSTYLDYTNTHEVLPIEDY